jgi:hypothetical protein
LVDNFTSEIQKEKVIEASKNQPWNNRKDIFVIKF